MQAPPPANTHSTHPLGYACGVGLASSASLGIYLGYSFGHGDTTRFWTVLILTGLLSALVAGLVATMRRR